jgi:hypothetical protein
MDLSVRVVLKDSTVKNLQRGLQAQYVQTFGPGSSPGEELDQARYRVSQLEKGLSIVDGTRYNVLAGLAELVKHVPPGAPLKVRTATTDQHPSGGGNTTFVRSRRSSRPSAAETFHDVSISVPVSGCAELVVSTHLFGANMMQMLKERGSISHNASASSWLQAGPWSQQLWPSC